MRALHSVFIKRWLESGTVDDWGNVQAGYSSELEEVKVYSIGPAYSSERESLIVEGLTIGSPSDYGLTPRDVVVIDGVEYAVEGEILDCNRGPFGYTPGYVFTVRRSER